MHDGIPCWRNSLSVCFDSGMYIYLLFVSAGSLKEFVVTAAMLHCESSEGRHHTHAY